MPIEEDGIRIPVKWQLHKDATPLINRNVKLQIELTGDTTLYAIGFE